MTARLVGDGVENPANAKALLDAAAMFEVPCLFRDSRGLAEQWSAERGGGPLVTVDTPELFSTPVVAVDNAPGANSVYASRLPAGRPSIVVGNERRGVRPDVVRGAARCVEIPMSGRGVDTLNVASAAAVAMYYLLQATRGRRTRSARRPEVLLVGPGDHVEAGSVLRSAAAFGWRTVGLDDRDKVWFGTPRTMRAEARAAARSHRNPLRVVPGPTLGFARAVVAGTHVDGPPLHRVDLAGQDTVLVIPDRHDENWHELAPRVEFARVDLPVADFPYRYRLVASIVLAEVARQLGPRSTGRPSRKRLTYDSAFDLTASADVDLVTPGELDRY
jgi:tRNA G18 (ribose-2'-O)-methylase SpoU